MGLHEHDGRLLQPPQTSSFDDWIAGWPGASAYFVFLNAQDRFGNVSSAEGGRFSTALGDWITFGVQHPQPAGIRPSQLVLLLVEEPHSPAQDNRIVTWARAIKAAQPAVRIWENPTYSDPSAAEARAFDTADV